MGRPKGILFPHQIPVKLTELQYRRLSRLSEKRVKSISSLIRKAVDNYLRIGGEAK